MVASINASLSSGIVTTADNSGSLQLQTGNTAALTIDTSQNVGIGTASPGYKLDIVGDIRLQGTEKKLYFDTTGASASNYVGITNTYYTTLYCGRGSTAQLDLTNSATILFSTNLTERMRIDSTGNVGIGTSTPNTKLESYISNPGALSDVLTLTNYTGAVSANTEVGVFFNPTNALNGIRGARISGINDGSNNVTLKFYTGAAATPTERMQISSSGNVGIGTANPNYKTVISNSGAEGIELGPGYSAGRNLFQSYNRTTSAYVQADYVASVHVWQTSATERLRITSNGGVSFGSSGTAYGTTGQVLTSAGDAPPTWNDSGQVQTQLFTSPGTWTKPATVTQVRVTVIGGGGAGAVGASVTSNSGGGFGGMATAIVPVSAPVTITVGTAPGGTSSFGPAVSATGGSNAPSSTTNGTDGTGTVSVGTTIRLSSSTSGGVIISNGSPTRTSGSSSPWTTRTFGAGTGGSNSSSTAGAGNAGAILIEYVG